MAKQVRLVRLTLTNFKGLRNAALDFSGDVTTISGRNGTGKTTVIDGFNWLLWGKDSEGNSDTKFGIKTNDANGAFLPHLDHEVTGTFEVTDTDTGETETKIFRRVLQEEWKERTDPATGETSEYLKGHHTNYYYNEMPLKTKAEYDRLVNEVIPEGLFKTITNPDYFLTLHWQEQRNALLLMAGEISDAQILAQDERFAALTELLQGKTLEGYKDKIKEDRAMIESELQKIPVRIDEVTRNTPAAIDFTALEQQLAQLTVQYTDVDKAMTSKAEANRQAYDDQQAKQTMLNDIRTKQNNILFAAKQQAAAEAYQANITYDGAKREFEDAEAQKKAERRRYDERRAALAADKKRAEDLIAMYTRQQDQARKEWFEENAKEFKEDGTICPLFKHVCADQKAVQQWHANIEAAREAFLTEKQTLLSEITKRGQQFGKMIANQQESITAAEAGIIELADEYAKKEEALKLRQQQAEETMIANPKQAPAEPKGEDIPEWVGLQKEAERIIGELQALQQQAPDNTAELRQQRNAIQLQMDGVKKELAKREQITQAQQRIDELNQRKKVLQQQKAQLQGKEDLIADFEKARMAEVERRVNGLFRYVKFKMYRTQIEDAKEVPDCVAYIDGVRYADKNRAGKINAGLDVINTLCAFHKVNAPIFIDNAESVNEFIPVGSQLIKLEVTTGDFTVI